MPVRYVPRHDTVLPRWIVYNPSSNDIIDLIFAAGDRQSYTFVIDGVPDRDSPKTGYSRGWFPGESLTLSFAKDRDEVEYELQVTANDAGYPVDNVRDAIVVIRNTASIEATDIITNITSFEQVYWYSLNSVAIIDRTDVFI